MLVIPSIAEVTAADRALGMLRGFIALRAGKVLAAGRGAVVFAIAVVMIFYAAGGRSMIAVRIGMVLAAGG